jgi:hypothetical protein
MDRESGDAMISLKRHKSFDEKLLELLMDVSEDPRYEFYFMSSWLDREIPKSDGWNYDTLGVMSGANLLGFIRWHINRQTMSADNVSLIVYPEYMSIGYGLKAAAMFVKWLSNHGYLRVEFSAHISNPANKFYRKLISCGARHVGTTYNSARNLKGQLVDEHLYELRFDDFVPSEFYQKLVMQ